MLETPPGQRRPIKTRTRSHTSIVSEAPVECRMIALAWIQVSRRCLTEPSYSPPARLSTASTGRSSASISLEYRVRTTAGLATPDVVARSGDPQISSAGPRPSRGSDKLRAASGAERAGLRRDSRRGGLRARVPRVAGHSGPVPRCSSSEQSRSGRVGVRATGAAQIAQLLRCNAAKPARPGIGLRMPSRRDLTTVGSAKTSEPSTAE